MKWIRNAYTYIPSRLCLLSTLHSNPLSRQEHCAELPALSNNFPLASYFIDGSIFMSFLLSQFIPQSPDMSTCPFSMPECCLTYFPYHNALEVHPYCKSQNFHLSRGWIAFYCISHLPNLLICWWTLRLFPYVGYCESCCSGHLRGDNLIDILF